MITIEVQTPAAAGGSVQENVGIDSRGVMTLLLGRGMEVPCEVTQVFSTGSDDQEVLTVPLVRGNRAMASDNTALGTLEIRGIPKSPAGVPQVAVTLAIQDGDLVAHVGDARGEFEVEASLLPAE